MSEQNLPRAAGRALTRRAGSSRKLLRRKALEKVADQPLVDALEVNFPSAGAREEPLLQLQRGALSPASAGATPPAQAGPDTWRDGEEASLQGLLAPNKAAGYLRRGRDVRGQRLQRGRIAPNPGTVIATVVAIVPEVGAITRAELFDRMTTNSFLHVRAKQHNRGWCQGYIAGAIRSGFLVIVSGASAAPADNEA